MKPQAILCAALAGTLGFSSLAIAQDGGRRGDREQRAEQRQDRREARQERRDDRREFRAERRDDRRDRRFDHAWGGDHRGGVRQAPDTYRHPGYAYQQPGYVYQQGHRHHAPRFHRGGYLPREYHGHGYRVSNWHAHPGLYAPPYGHQWMQVGSDFLLVAVATGLIANLLTQ